ncbi:hypothetical protein [Rhizobium binxianense]|jgi:hypothetical protein
MLSSETTARPQAGALGGIDQSEPLLPLELLELELSLEGYDGGEAGFCDAVRKAADAAGGEFLFDLPAIGLLEDCRRIAALRVPSSEDKMCVVFALLDGNGTEIRVQAPNEETSHLVRLANAFVEVLKRI